jgi:hypothetical protein
MTAVATNSMTDLVRFLIARVDDDDTALKHESRDRARGKAQTVAVPRSGYDLRSLDRLRAENAAKREVIAAAQHLLVLRDQPAEKPVRDGAATILQAMAGAYAEHPSFRSEWR